MEDGATPHAATRVIDLAGLVLPKDGPWARDHVRPPARRTAHYMARFDRRTLFYDAVRHGDGTEVLITAPPPANLAPLLRGGFRAGGRPLTTRFRQAAKHAQLCLRGVDGPLTLRLGDREVAIAPRADVAADFAGLHVAVTVNKDNSLSAFRLWAAHHVRLHGLQGVLVYDNGSAAYAPQELAAALARVPGLRQVTVARAPYPYGTTDKVLPGEVRPNYLQPALLTLARTDLLRRARAVLNVDVDEMVLSRDGRSVFDRAARAWHGTARLPVYWAEPPPGTDGPRLQSAHVWRDDPKPRTPRKWCARPGGPLSRLGWHVHHVGGEVFKLIPEARAHEVVHCRATTTGWNARKSRLTRDAAKTRDPELAALWDGAAEPGAQ